MKFIKFYEEKNICFAIDMKIVLVLLFSMFSLFSEKINYISFSSGFFDVMREKHKAYEYRIEYKPGIKMKKIRPMVGLLGTARGSLFIYGGLNLELYFSKYIYFAPSLAIGCYYRGKGKDLYFPIEFKSGLDLGVELNNKHRISIQISHMSNAHLGSNNPGQESLVLVYSFPFVSKCK